MRIAFIGASGTGKTTLAKWVAETYSLPLNPVGARSVARDMGFETPYDVDQADADTYGKALLQGSTLDEAACAAMREWSGHGESVRAQFQLQLHREKLRWERKHEDFVSDRSPLDDMAYAIQHCCGAVDTDFILRAVNHVRLLDALFFCPLTAFYAHDGDKCRVEDRTYHHIFEMILRGIVAGEKIPTVTLHEPGLQERKARIGTIISALLRRG